jgi:hypothetical protein
MKTLNEWLIQKKCINLFPTNDIASWIKFSEYNFIYDKLSLAQLQNLECAPLPISPQQYPVIVKPIINLYGMSRGLKKINNYEEFILIKENGYFWEKYLDGDQYNYDLVIENGKIIDSFCYHSMPLNEGTFLYHKYIKNNIPKNIVKLIETLMTNYTGFMNIELIDGYIIEAHLRLNGDFFIFEEVMVDNFINFIKNGVYTFHEITPKTFFPIFIKTTDLIKAELTLAELTLAELKSAELTLAELTFAELTLAEYIMKVKNISFNILEKWNIDYKIDDINSENQGDIYKRLLYFICTHELGLSIQKEIYLAINL